MKRCRSRNAVVALKRRCSRGCSRIPSSKQERRGGIETAPGVDDDPLREPKQERRGGIETSRRPQAACPSRRKQERRGGIETILPGPAGKREPARSRNAVVALKLAEALGQILKKLWKQERRGGIETGSQCARPARARPKQERRGGIETRSCSARSWLASFEAGTPWWH